MDKNKKVLIISVIVTLMIVGVAVFLLMDSDNLSLNTDNNTPNVEIDDLPEFKDDLYTKYYSHIDMMDIHPTVSSDIYMIDSRIYVSFVGKIPRGNTDSSMYVIYKAIKGKEIELKTKLEEYLQIHINRWDHLPEQKKLAQEAEIGIKGDTVYLVIGKDAKKIVKLI